MERSKQDCIHFFKQRFGQESEVLSAPGRANIIGEHTDYNQGFVLPFAIDKFIHFVAAKSDARYSVIHALNLGQEIRLDKDSSYKGFGKYLHSCIAELKKDFPNEYQVNVVFGGDLPIGAGISSSSALCCGFLRLLSNLHEINLNADQLLDLAIRAERGAAMEGGIMDQFTIINGRKHQAILLDCLDQSTQYFSYEFPEYSFCIYDSKVAHNLAETSYSERVATCKSALLRVKKLDSSVGNFRSLNSNHLGLLESIERKRIAHLLSENERVLKAVGALKNKNPNSLGKLLNESHKSLRDDYEVSCDELNFIVNELQSNEACLGARMMGGGFGGSVIALVRKEDIDAVSNDLRLKYQKKFNLDLNYFEVTATDGLIP